MNDLPPKGAILSEDRVYRYLLWRQWEATKPYVLFIGLNPSIADEIEDDPTIRRCVGFAKSWGYGAVVMMNLFAVRATKPKDMLNHEQPIGEDNDQRLLKIADNAGLVVCAWGGKGGHLNRGEEVSDLLKGYELKCLGTTQAGDPRHPLYIKADKELEDFK